MNKQKSTAITILHKNKLIKVSLKDLIKPADLLLFNKILVKVKMRISLILTNSLNYARTEKYPYTITHICSCV